MVVITAISIDVCACVITTATSIKAPCISQWRSSPPASSSSLGESFPEESLQGCRLPRKQEVPFWLLGTDPPNSGAPCGWRPCPPVSGSRARVGPALHPLGPPSSLALAPSHRVRRSPSRTMARLSWGYGEHNGERDFSRGRCRLMGLLTPVGGWGPGAWFLVCSFSGSLEKPTTVRGKPERSELRWHTCEERRTTSGRHGYWSLSHGTPSRDCWRNLSNL